MLRRAVSVNLDAHGGLRGVSALWIMFFHYFLYSKTPLDFQGSSIMPLFFMLSGFSLAVTYGSPKSFEIQQTDTNNPLSDHANDEFIDAEHAQGHENSKSNVIDFWKFQRNRWARIYPVYLLCTALALPYCLAGYGPATGIGLLVSTVTSVIPVCTFFIFLLGSSLDGPGWTVCTLLVLYLFFPHFQRRASFLSDDQLARRICSSYWLQFALVFILFFALAPFLGFWPAFAAATMHPFSRLPLFVMGVYAGELALRCTDKSYPWPTACLFLFPPYLCDEGAAGCSSSLCCCPSQPASLPAFTSLLDAERDKRFWSEVLTHRSVYIFCITMAVMALDTIDRYAWQGGGILGAVWLQSLLPYLQLEIIVAFTRDPAKFSIVSRMMTNPLALYLGEVSMAVYLVHFLSLSYFLWMLEETSLPLWAIPALAVISFAASVLVFKYVEEPCRHILRSQ